MFFCLLCFIQRGWNESPMRDFPYKPTLSEIKEAIPDLNGDINWIALDKREVEIKKTTLLGITNPKNI